MIIGHRLTGHRNKEIPVAQGTGPLPNCSGPIRCKLQRMTFPTKPGIRRTNHIQKHPTLSAVSRHMRPARPNLGPYRVGISHLRNAVILQIKKDQINPPIRRKGIQMPAQFQKNGHARCPIVGAIHACFGVIGIHIGERPRIPMGGKNHSPWTLRAKNTDNIAQFKDLAIVHGQGFSLFNDLQAPFPESGYHPIPATPMRRRPGDAGTKAYLGTNQGQSRVAFKTRGRRRVRGWNFR